MIGTTSPGVVRAAIGLNRSHPLAPPLDILDVCFRQHVGSLTDLGPEALDPCGPFGQLLAAAFDRGMDPSDWQLVRLAEARDALLQVWRECVIGPFCERYGLWRG